MSCPIAHSPQGPRCHRPAHWHPTPMGPSLPHSGLVCTHAFLMLGFTVISLCGFASSLSQCETEG